MLKHGLIQGLLALTVTLFLASDYSRDLTGKTATWILNTAGVRTEYVSPPCSMYVRLIDGTIASFQVLTECSGLVTIAIFSLVSTFTVGLLRGSVLKKMAWFLLSMGFGLAWNINRLAFVIIIAYHFGLSAFSFTHYLLGPFTDFVWVVAMWSLGMSWLRGGVET